MARGWSGYGTVSWSAARASRVQPPFSTRLCARLKEFQAEPKSPWSVGGGMSVLGFSSRSGLFFWAGFFSTTLDRRPSRHPRCSCNVLLLFWVYVKAMGEGAPVCFKDEICQVCSALRSSLISLQLSMDCTFSLSLAHFNGPRRLFRIAGHRSPVCLRTLLRTLPRTLPRT